MAANAVDVIRVVADVKPALSSVCTVSVTVPVPVTEWTWKAA
jgi:hypothetical protein